MSLRLLSNLGSKVLQEKLPTALCPIITGINHQQVRYRKTKHWIPKWKALRRAKVVKVKLPKFNENTDDFTEEEIRSRMKEMGLMPRRPWHERNFFINSTSAVFEPYVPAEGDGKISPITAQGAKQKLQFVGKKSKTMMAIRKVRTFEEDFDSPEFCKQAESIYIKMHEHLEKSDTDNIIKYVTERAYPEVLHNIKNKTIKWKFLKSIELPYIVHARCTDVISKQNIFAQITVRFHTQQMLAIFDRFGRLMHGSEIIAKDVLEYVVFEKHLANEYGIWRIHDKIIPDWLPPKEPAFLTYKKKITPEVEIIEENKVEEVKEDTVVAVTSDSKPPIKEQTL